jgi:hypothetical protein
MINKFENCTARTTLLPKPLDFYRGAFLFVQVYYTGTIGDVAIKNRSDQLRLVFSFPDQRFIVAILATAGPCRVAV